MSRERFHQLSAVIRFDRVSFEIKMREQGEYSYSRFRLDVTKIRSVCEPNERDCKIEKKRTCKHMYVYWVEDACTGLELRAKLVSRCRVVSMHSVVV